MDDALDIAKRMIEVIPPSVHRIRNELNQTGLDGMTNPQFRILANISQGRNRVSEIARYHGVSQPGMSKMVDGLVLRGYIRRAPDSNDRRQIHLELSKSGERTYKKIKNAVEAKLGQKIANLEALDRSELKKGLAILEKLFELGSARQSLRK